MGQSEQVPRSAVMSDVARLAGVSHQTVSRVLHDSPRVRPETRARVEAAMKTLDYRPNTVARALVTGRTRTLGVISFATTLHGPASTLLGIERAPHDADYFIIVASLRSFTHEAVLGAVDRLRDRGGDGIVVIAPHDAAGGGRGGGARRAVGRRGRPAPGRRPGHAAPTRARASHRVAHRRPAGLGGGAAPRRRVGGDAACRRRRGAAPAGRRPERAVGL